MEKGSFDAVIVGSGAAGLTAAVVAAQAGLKVALLESTSRIGGTTALSGGAIWIPLNHKMGPLGLSDDTKNADSYLKAVLGNAYNQRIAEAYIQNGDEMLRHIEAITELRMQAVPAPDYYPAARGWAVGRTLLPVAFEGGRLKRHLSDVRRPLPGLTLFSDMQLTPGDAATMIGWKQSFSNMRATTSLLGRYVRDRVFHNRGMRLAGGNAVVAALYQAARRYGVTILLGAKATKLVESDGRITGVQCTIAGKHEVLSAHRGVLIATGGCGADAVSRQAALPNADHGWSFQPEGCVGDGSKMAAQAGAALDAIVNVIWTPASQSRDRKGRPLFHAAFWLDRHCPGSIMVDATGRRFVDESYHYQHIGQTALTKSIDRFWMISDHRAARKYGIGLARPAPFSIDRWVVDGYLVKADDLTSLASKLGVSANVLADTVARFNRGARVGIDPEFHRGKDAYSGAMGDAAHTPNPCLAPLSAGPYYALELRPCDLGVGRGILIDDQARALDTSGAAIPGLYAAGLDASSILRGQYAGGGAAIGSAMTFAYIAAKSLMQAKPATAPPGNALPL